MASVVGVVGLVKTDHSISPASIAFVAGVVRMVGFRKIGKKKERKKNLPIFRFSKTRLPFFVSKPTIPTTPNINAMDIGFLLWPVFCRGSKAALNAMDVGLLAFSVAIPPAAAHAAKNGRFNRAYVLLVRAFGAACCPPADRLSA